MAGYDFEFYETGKISVTAGQKAFTGSGTAWKLRGCEGALVVVVGAGTVNFVSSLSTDAAGDFRTAWAGPTLANASYVMWLPSAVAATALANHQRLAEIISSIQTAQPASEILASLAGLTLESGNLIVSNSAKSFRTTPISNLASTILGRASGSQMYGDLGAIPDASAPNGFMRMTTDVPAGDCNLILENGTFLVGSGAANIPIPASGFIVMMRQTNVYGRQLYYQRDSTRIFSRNWTAGVWGDWTEIGGTGQGFFTLPGGSIVQWGRTQAATSSSTLLTIPLNTTFPVGIQTAIGINGDWTNSNVRTNTWVFYAPGSNNSQVSFATSAINQTVITCWVAFGR